MYDNQGNRMYFSKTEVIVHIFGPCVAGFTTKEPKQFLVSFAETENSAYTYLHSSKLWPEIH
jgi:hypothetical protein